MGSTVRSIGKTPEETEGKMGPRGVPEFRVPGTATTGCVTFNPNPELLFVSGSRRGRLCQHGVA